MIKSLTAYIWPAGDTDQEKSVRRRVVTALGLMVASKVIRTLINNTKVNN